MPFKNYKNTSFYLTVSVFVIVFFRLILTAVIPVFDKTESRYAEIARLMNETKEWVVLQIDYSIPFWAKPPLSTWLSAISFETFGVSEFAVRFPSFLLAIFLLLLLGKMAKKEGLSFYLPAFILLTMPEFLIHTGVVSTDSALSFSIALMMISFWKAMQNETKTFWNYVFFIGLGLGFLAKGPIILILTIPPIFFWILLQKIAIKTIYTKLPWFTGLLLTTIISIPWYILAEQRSPGFLDYFIVGEHFNRFLVPGWKGDLYGSGHSQPLGMIWLFLLAFTFPWIQIVLYKLWKERKTIFKDKYVSYLVFWLFWTPLFFTISKNILHTYILPVTIPIALLMMYWWKNQEKKKTILIVSSIFPALVFVAFFGGFLTGKLNYYMNSDKYLIKNQPIDFNHKESLYYWKEKSYSGQFYSNGKAKVILDTTALDAVLKSTEKSFFMVSNRRKKDIPKEYQLLMKPLDSNYKNILYVLKPWESSVRTIKNRQN
ncbi:MAG: phospholipid carrier-dependent glycosyltransferase [Flavobacteriaceae bacterium CG2_30_34_30]|nr:MAG: phospholipid carrier-dependent glycosyltransferase [Flavobacteriaceae bacterium CG2_30_34_30]